MRVGHPTLGNFVGIVEIFTGNARSLPHTIGESHKLKITSKFRWKFKKYQTLNQHIVRLISLLHISHFQELEIGKSDRMTSGRQGITRVPAAAVKNYLSFIFASAVWSGWKLSKITKRIFPGLKIIRALKVDPFKMPHIFLAWPFLIYPSNRQSYEGFQHTRIQLCGVCMKNHWSHWTTCLED
jgi:hypothetical protein